VTHPGQRGFLLTAVFLFAPPAIAFAAGDYERRVMTLAGIYALAVLGYQLVFGRIGALSLAQGCFFGLGAYTTGLLGIHFGWTFPASFLAAAIVPALLAFVVALPVLRLGSHYFALATLGISQVVLLVAVNWTDVTGGANGLYGIPEVSILDRSFSSSEAMLVLVWGTLAVAVTGVSAMLRGRASHRLSVLRDAPEAAASIGIDAAAHRLALFLASAALGGVAGALQAHSVGVVSPAVAEFHVMVTILAMTVVGGRGHPAGAILGAVLLVHLPEWFRFLEANYLIAHGAALLLAVILLPQGLAGLFQRWLGEKPHFKPHTDVSSDRNIPAVRRASDGLEINNVEKRFGGIVALDKVSLRISAGEIVGLIGPNGSGKTTLVNVISGLVAPDRGRLVLDKQEIGAMGPHLRARLGLGRSFQSPATTPTLTILESVLAATSSNHDNATAQRLAESCLAFVDLSGWGVEFSGTLPPAKARDLDLARLLAAEPSVVMLDEPAAGLTPTERARLANRLKNLAEAGLGILVIDHSMDFLLPLADRVICLASGVIVSEGRPEEVARHPAAIAAYFGEGRR